MIRPWSVAGEIGAGRPWRRSESHRLNTHGWRLWLGFPLIGLCRTGRRQAGKRRLGVVILASLMLLPLVFSIATGAFATNAAAQTTQGFPDYSYVAFGDSLTTGYSIPSCTSDKVNARDGCQGQRPATPYPELVRERATGALTNLPLARVGIWGYTADEARTADLDGQNAMGPWEPQFRAVAKTTKLVTGALGINDLHFSDPPHWATVCTKSDFSAPGANIPFTAFDEANCRNHALEHINGKQMRDAFDQMFLRLGDAQNNSARAVIPLYYNPYAKRSPCSYLHGIADVIVGELNTELRRRAAGNNRPDGNNIRLADAYPAFVGHGAGVDGDQEYVFGTECEDGKGFMRGVAGRIQEIGPNDETTRELQADYDPHPNGKGSSAIADTILAAGDDCYNGFTISQPEIRTKWLGLGGCSGPLGKLTSNTLTTSCAGGRYSRFERGTITWRSDVGAHGVHGDIHTKWASLGSDCGVLGLPVSDQYATSFKPGQVQNFQAGNIYSAAGAGVNEIHGLILGKYAAMGYEGSLLGFPTSDESPTSCDGGRYNNFQAGAITYRGDLGAHPTGGAIRAKWASLGYECGYLGLPMSDELDDYGPPPGGFVGQGWNGRKQYFERNDIFWNRFSGETIAYGEGGAITGNYYSNYDYSRVALRRPDPTIDFSWGAGSPHPAVSADYFYAQWRGRLQIPQDGYYTFYTISDDGVKFHVCPDPRGSACGDGATIYNWTNHSPTEDASAPIYLRAGSHHVFLEYYDSVFDATLKLLWSGPGIPKQIIPGGSLRSAPIGAPDPPPPPATPQILPTFSGPNSLPPPALPVGAALGQPGG